MGGPQELRRRVRANTYLDQSNAFLELIMYTYQYKGDECFHLTAQPTEVVGDLIQTKG